MLKRSLTLGLVFGTLCMAAVLWSSFTTTAVHNIDMQLQEGDTTKKKPQLKPGKKIPVYTPLFACKFKGGKIKKQEVLSNLSGTFCVQNEDTKEKYKVVGYDMNYAELGYYEDSLGIPTLMTEYFYNECKGDSIVSMWQKSYNERLHRGDTLKFSEFVFIIDGRSLKIKNKLNLVIE
jgi:hypothetical protein